MKKTLILPSLLVFLFGAVMSGAVLFFLFERESSDIETETLRAAHELKESIQGELLKSKSLLRGIGGLFHSSKYVEREEFATFCKSSISSLSPVRLVEWQPKVLSSERKTYERRAQRDGLKDFHFFEIDDQGNQIPAANRPVHFPVFYSYSPQENVISVGLDLVWSPLRMKSKYESMRSGSMMASETFGVVLKNTKEKRLGMAITHSVFKDLSTTSSETIEPLLGFLAIVLDMKIFFDPVASLNRLKNFQFAVKDESDNQKVLYSTLVPGDFESKIFKSQFLELGGRKWGLYVYPTKGYFFQKSSLLPWVIFFLILVLSLSLAFYLYIKNVNQVKIRLFERQLQQKQRLESIGVLASGVAHEFNNALQCITLANENLKDCKDNQSKNEYIDVSLEYCERGKNLVRQILSFAREESEGEKSILPSKEILNVMKIITTSLGLNIQFFLKIEEVGDKPMMMGINHISQILVNLCNNAAHAMNKAGVIEVAYEVAPGKRILRVKDNGKGMDEAVMQKVFDPFFTTKDVHEGTGLGLSVIYGIVKSYNGDISVSSRVGVGTEFTITLPENRS